MTPQDATGLASSLDNAVSSTVMSVPNNDPINNLANAQRVTQQQILPTALQNKFLNPVSQSPEPVVVASITLNDIRQSSTHISDGLAGRAQPYAIFGFSYTGTSQDFVKVELCTSIFIDEINIGHAYPVGGRIFIANWNVTRLKDARTFVAPSGTRPLSYNVNQANQDFEWLVIECFDGGGDHDIFVQFYWRAILNTGAVGSGSH